jgi:hypothetical protein
MIIDYMNYSVQHSQLAERLSGTLASPDVRNELRYLHAENPKKSIMTLLFRKQNSIIESFTSFRDFKQKSVNMSYNHQKEFSLIEVNLDKENFYNSKINFSETNKLIMGTRLSPLKVNTLKALDLLKEIERNISEESKEDFLLEGI